MKKKKIMEILDSNEVIIGSDDKPIIDKNANTQSNATTDKIAKVAHQPHDDKFWGTFGFSLYEDEKSKINMLSEEEMIKIVEDIISKRTDKSINSKKKDKSEIVDNKVHKIKELFADLSDQEKGDLISKLKNK